MESMEMQHSKPASMKQYQRLLIMVVLSFIAMYVLMYTMVDSLVNVVPNYNQFYMAGLMTMPMVIIEMALMSAMYMNKRLNTIILSLSAVLLIVFFLFVRQQTGIGDKQFLKSMIPHHAAAILMCKEAAIEDPEIEKLCNDIVTGQQAEIDFMKAKLEQLKKKQTDFQTFGSLTSTKK